MRLKIILLICPLLLIKSVTFANTVADSIGVENQDGKKVILHKIEPKETYYAVGRRYNIKPNLIIQFNNNIVLQPGQTIKVPTDLPFADAKPTATQAVANKPDVKQTVQQFKVSQGETLYSIARRFGTTVDEIKAQNNLKSDVVQPGEVLNIKTSGVVATTTPATPKETVTETKPVTPVTQPQVKPQVQPPVTQPQTEPAQTAATTPVSTTNTQQYKVSNGETLYTIAKRFNTSVDDIVALNHIQNNTITPGQLLTVRSGMPPAATVAAVPKPQEVTAPRDSTTPTGVADSVGDKHVPSNRYGLFEKNEKGPATWMDDTGIDPKKQLVLHRTAPIGTVLRITNPMTNRTVFAKVVGRFTDNESNKDAIVVVTKGVADALGAMDKRFRVNISYGVPANEQ